MASTKTKPTTETAPTVKAAPVVYSKHKILTFQKYAGRRDLLSVLLKDGKEYTMEQVDGLISKFMKGKVK